MAWDILGSQRISTLDHVLGIWFFHEALSISWTQFDQGTLITERGIA